MVNRQKIQDIAFILPAAGLLLLLPPILTLSANLGYLKGVPLLPIYLFTIWFALILAAFLVTRQLAKIDDAPQSQAEIDDDNADNFRM